MKIILIGNIVVLGAESYKTFISDVCNCLFIWIGAYLCNHHINSQVKLFAIKQQWISEVFLCDVALGEGVRRDLIELLSQEYATPFSTSVRLHNESLFLICRHIFLQSICLVAELKCQWDKIKIVFEVSLHTFGDLRKSCLVCGHTGSRQAIKNGCGAHDTLIVYAKKIWVRNIFLLIKEISEAKFITNYLLSDSCRGNCQITSALCSLISSCFHLYVSISA